MCDRFLCMSCVLLFSLPLLATADEIKQILPTDAHWKPLYFDKVSRHSSYLSAKDEDGRPVFYATSNNAASGMIYPISIDPEQFPVVSWRWKTNAQLSNGDMKTKAGDDMVARLYLLFKYEPERTSFFKRMLRGVASAFYGQETPGTSLNYVWANRYPVGTLARNPYVEDSAVFVVESGKLHLHKWRFYRRHILDDYQAAFGYSPPQIVGVAIMTDTDNTHAKAGAWYGEITFSTR